MTRTGRRIVVAAAAIVSLVPLSFALVIFSNALFVALQAGAGAKSATASSRGADVPLTVTVFGRSDDTISARVSFADSDGANVSTLERSWAGWELTFDFIVVRSGGRWYAFPYTLSSDATGPGGGVDLVRYYDDEGFPAIFGSKSLDAETRRILFRIFSIVKTERWVPAFLGTLNHERLTIREFDSGIPYFVRVSAKGKPYLVR